MSTPFLRPILATALVTIVLVLPSRADDFPTTDTIAKLATPTAATANHAPSWTKGGTYAYRMSTPDVADVLPYCEQGFCITHHLLDDSIKQVIIANGLVGTDHKGPFNWDGSWPYWDHPTFRSVDWKHLDDFMLKARDKDNTYVGFHVNLTDVNAGLADSPEFRAFFKKLVETKSIYKRDMNPVTKKRDIDPPYVPQQLPTNPEKGSMTIFALVNYKNFYDSGVGPKMIDSFYSHLPYAPPLLYLDVLMLQGANFTTGYPDGPLGGSQDTQLEGVLNLVAYLNKKGTSVATEGDRPFVTGKGATYGWLHCLPGYSSDDYSYIAGVAKYCALQQVAGNTGGFNLSPIASTPEILASVRKHYANLLAGKPDDKPMPGLDTWHIADKTDVEDKWDMIPAYNGKPGLGGDRYRGDWADLVNNFYLTGIQELYYIGKGDYRTAIYDKEGMIHVTKIGLTDASGKESDMTAVDLAPDKPKDKENAKESGEVMLAPILEFHFNAPAAGTYKVTLYGGNPGNGAGAANLYANGAWAATAPAINFPSHTRNDYPIELGNVPLKAGDNIVAIDAGPIYMRWSDGTEAIWTTPYLRKGFEVKNGDVTFAKDYDRMWPDTWSGQKKIYFFSWDGTDRPWKLPADWAAQQTAKLYPLTPDGRGAAVPVSIAGGSVAPKLLPQIPYVLVAP